ncbi:transmembrane protein 26-like [Dreissena polymorpha]|uniref:Transmembrane protein 26 n=1 Tax=Dreissena polymorpha TaxID=45954 RepID=A0A9D4LM31_DREPO|nr:transmembrane protein 26-like [Dreissena polymorpha]KAH3861290.1 hypothetical protein DPMN_024217 [Dreissena polymorpha]
MWRIQNERGDEESDGYFIYDTHTGQRGSEEGYSMPKIKDLSTPVEFERNMSTDRLIGSEITSKEHLSTVVGSTGHHSEDGFYNCRNPPISWIEFQNRVLASNNKSVTSETQKATLLFFDEDSEDSLSITKQADVDVVDTSIDKDIFIKTDEHKPVDNGISVITHPNKVIKDDFEGLKTPTDLNTVLSGNRRDIFWAVLVRIFLVSHSLIAIWRVTEAYSEPLYWFLAASNMFLLLETSIVIVGRAGIEYSWWTPCFLFYLGSTIPAIWLLELHLYRDATSMNGNINNGSSSSAVAIANTTDNYTTVTTPVSIKEVTFTGNRIVLNNNLWAIIIEESLVYLLVFSRWLLPRGKVTRIFLADLLLEFLAIASDIMELLAVFDESAVRQNGKLTIVIMAVWSASFVQFIPILVHKKRFQHVRSPKVPCITRCFSDKFVEIVVTLMSICLQDLPFLVVRLYIVIEIQILTYSLLFFILKNLVSLMLLCYRLIVIFRQIPMCRRAKKMS